MIGRTGALAATATATFLLAACGPGAPETYDIERTPGRPVLLVTIDTLRWDALGSYGSDTPTPALDALAERGLRAEHAVAHAVVTLPSHSTLLTGLDPTRHGVHSNEGHRLGDSLTTWAERLKAAGYDTGAFVGAFPVDSQFGLAQGFDVYDDDLEDGRVIDATDPAGAGPPSVERRAEAVVESALGWLAGRDEAPWFAWVHVYDPHDPYRAPEPFDSRHPDDPYAGEVAYVDSALAPLLEEARARDAIVVVTADHGEALGEHGEETHGLFAYASTLRVPLILAGIEGAPEGAVLPGRVRHIDVLPTVLDTLGLDHDDLPGLSLWAGGARDESYFEALTPYLDWGWKPLRGVYAGTVKYLDLPDRDTGWPPLHGIYSGDLKLIDLPIPELYDVAADPGETDNLAGRRPLEVRRLRERLRAHMASADAPEAARVAEDAETLRRLEALGYLGGGGGPREGVSLEDYAAEDDPKRLVELEATIQAGVRAMRRPGGDREAIVAFEEVLRRRPDLIRAYTLLASVQRRQGGAPGAVQVLERALAAGADAPYVHETLAGDYARMGRLAEAEAAARRGLASAPDDVDLLGMLATILAERGRVDAARETFDRALGLAPDRGRLHADLGTLLLSTGRPREAEAAFTRALELDRSLAEAHNGLGVIASQGGDIEGAVAHWRRAIDADPEQAFVLYNLGIALRRLGRTDEAIDALERYLRLEPSDAETRAMLAELRGG